MAALYSFHSGLDVSSICCLVRTAGSNHSSRHRKPEPLLELTMNTRPPVVLITGAVNNAGTEGQLGPGPVQTDMLDRFTGGNQDAKRGFLASLPARLKRSRTPSFSSPATRRASSRGSAWPSMAVSPRSDAEQQSGAHSPDRPSTSPNLEHRNDHHQRPHP
jgi:hypothetical protein